jgi:transcription elongation factor Elf1
MKQYTCEVCNGIKFFIFIGQYDMIMVLVCDKCGRHVNR